MGPIVFSCVPLVGLLNRLCAIRKGRTLWMESEKC